MPYTVSNRIAPVQLHNKQTVMKRIVTHMDMWPTMGLHGYGWGISATYVAAGKGKPKMI
jgi:hypothetical protein